MINKKLMKIKCKENISKTTGEEKLHITCRGTMNQMMTDFSSETMDAIRQ